MKSVYRNKTSLWFAILGIFMLLFIIAPIGKILLSAQGPNLLQALYDQEVLASIWLTMSSALWATLFTLIFGVPLAYLLARNNFWGKKIIEGIIDLPVVIPHTAAGIALLTVFGQRFFMGKVLSFFGLSAVGTRLGIVIAMTFVSAPFLINAAKEAFKLVDPKLENAARTLGASPWQAFWKITLPLSKRAIFSGMIMMWARGISEFGAIVILAYHPMVAPVLIFERFEAFGLKYAQPVAVILVLISLIIFTVLRTIVNRNNAKVN
ncbi:MAG: ABC transporter permease [Pseudomonadota bacterium]